MHRLLPLVALIACNPNTPPSIADQAVNTDEDTAVTIALEASDDDGDALTITITSQPSRGTLSEVTDGSVVYTPEPDYNGGDSFAYTVTDGGAEGPVGPAQVSITIEPVNDPPTFTAEGAELGFVGVLAGWTATTEDVDGDTVEVTWTASWLDNEPNGNELEWRPRHAGVYSIEAVASDGTVETEPVNFDLRVHQIVGGQEHTLWVRPNGELWAWGDNGQGQLGTGFDRDSAVPQPVCEVAGSVPGAPCDTPLGDVVQVAAGDTFSMALQADGTVLTWGDNEHGQLGDGCTVATDCVENWLPTAVTVPTGGHDIGAGPFSAYVVNTDGTVFAWGANDVGQLGRGDLIDSASPLEVCADWDEIGLTCNQPLTASVQVEGGLDDSEHAGAIREDGTVWMWGDGDDGKRGDGCDNCDARAWASPVCTHALDPFDECASVFEGAEWLAIGEDHTLVLADDARLYAFGDNGSGQLGTACIGGNCDDLVFPEPVCGNIDFDVCTQYMEDVTAFAAGENHTVIVQGDGAVWMVGDNNDGQLGNGCDPIETDCPDQTDLTPPCALEADGGCPTPLTDVFAAAAGTDHVVVVLDDGRVVGWGDNNDGQVGDGSAWSSVARPSHAGTDWEHIGAGEGFSVARNSANAVWAWGTQENGVLADGCALCDETVVEPGQALIEGAALTDWESISAHEEWVMGRRGGILHVWGSNDDGQLGPFVGDFSSLANPSIPQPGGGTPMWVDHWSGAWHGLGLQADGSLWGWGTGNDGQLGDGLEDDSTAPVQVLGANGIDYDTDWDFAAAGYEHSLAVKDDGTLWAWGEGSSGELGDGLAEDQPAPVQVGTDTDWAAVSAGWDFSVGIKDDGTLWAWGSDSDGVLGQGCTDACDDAVTPTQVGTDTDWAGAVASDERVLAWKTDGSLYAWGEDSDGNLGLGSQEDVTVPTPVCSDYDWNTRTCTTQLTGVSMVAASPTHTLAIVDGGVLWAWGDNCDRQLGIGGGCQVASATEIWVP